MQIISIHDYNIIAACKKDDNMVSLIWYLKDYLLLNEVDDYVIYKQLCTTIFNISTPEELSYIFEDELLNYYHELNRNNQVKQINIQDLNRMLYYHLYFLDVLKRTQKQEGNKTNIIYEDLYMVNDNHTYIPYSEYHSFQKTKKRLN